MATKLDLSSYTLDELDALIAEATKFKTEKVNARRSELLAELEKLGGVPKAPDNGNRIGNGKSRGPAAVKYRDDKGNQWTGRGNPPKWLAAYEAEGRSRDEFLVK